MEKSHIGIYGLGVMGQSLAKNMARNGFTVSAYNKDASFTDRFLANGEIESVRAFYDLESFIDSLSSPRLIFLMVTAGRVVDLVIEALLPHLNAGDVIMDGGNSYFKDTNRRCRNLEEKGIHFLGVGVSGGEMGALWGPSMMPGGNAEAYTLAKPILTGICAKTESGFSCCDYIGKEGSGHYVKMVHNGIEYADIQLICEAYHLMRQKGMSPDEIKTVFGKWNQGRLHSYLIEITEKILGVVDEETGLPLIDVILDTAAQKGTGKWTSMESLDMGTPIPTIIEAVCARYLSAKKKERVKLSKVFACEKDAEPVTEAFLEDLEQALYCAKICAYAQGFALMADASDAFGWNLDLGRIALLWQEGCIIRADFLVDIHDAFKNSHDNLIASDKFLDAIQEGHKAWRRIIASAVLDGTALPCMMSALSYFDSITCEHSPANLLQAQRDFFGAHTYERVDREGSFHTIWE